jgi:hypothetical protein
MLLVLRHAAAIAGGVSLGFACCSPEACCCLHILGLWVAGCPCSAETQPGQCSTMGCQPAQPALGWHPQTGMPASSCKAKRKVGRQAAASAHTSAVAGGKTLLPLLAVKSRRYPCIICASGACNSCSTGALVLSKTNATAAVAAAGVPQQFTAASCCASIASASAQRHIPALHALPCTALLSCLQRPQVPRTRSSARAGRQGCSSPAAAAAACCSSG